MRSLALTAILGLALAAAGLAEAAPGKTPAPAPAAAVAPEPPRGVRTRVVLLGTSGGPSVRATRSQPASLVVVDGRPYLFDAGEGMLTRLAQAGFQPSQVEAVFLTHLHFDHTAGLASFMAFDWTNRRDRTVRIFGPPGTEALTRAGLAYFAIPEGIFSQQIPLPQPMEKLFVAHDVDTVGQQLVFQDDKIRVTAAENSHYGTMTLAKQAYGTPRSYSYRVETPDRVIVFTGDTGPTPALTELARGADLLVTEVIDADKTVALLHRLWAKTDPAALQPLIDHMVKEHFQPEDIGRTATAAGVKMVVLTHYAPGADDELDPTPYVAGVRRTYAGPVVAGRDLDSF